MRKPRLETCNWPLRPRPLRLGFEGGVDFIHDRYEATFFAFEYGQRFFVRRVTGKFQRFAENIEFLDDVVDAVEFLFGRSVHVTSDGLKFDAKF